MPEKPSQPRRSKAAPPASGPVPAPSPATGTPAPDADAPVRTVEPEALPAPRKKRTHDFNRVRPSKKRPAAPKPAVTVARPQGRAAQPAADAGDDEAAGEAEDPGVEEITGDEAEPAEAEGGNASRLADLPVEDEEHPEPAAGAIVPAPREALAPTDLLQRYMAEVGRYPLLSREEETALARRYQATGEEAAAYKLVTANLRLVVKIAWEYRRAAFNLLDLVQEGNVGLMQAVRKFDPDRGVKLSTYAAWWIRAYIIRHLMDNWRLVKLGTTQAQRKIFFNLRKEKEKLAQQGFEPEPRLLAERLQVSEQDVVDMDRRLSNDEFSLDAPLPGDTGGSYGDRLAQGGEAVDERLADSQLGAVFHEKLAEFAKGLSDKERFIYEKRLVAEEPLTLQEVGDHYGISRERARQIEARLTQRLRSWMQEHLPDYAQLSLQPRED